MDGVQGNDSNFTWAELNSQSGISKQWDSTSFEDQNALEAKASIGISPSIFLLNFK